MEWCPLPHGFRSGWTWDTFEFVMTLGLCDEGPSPLHVNHVDYVISLLSCSCWDDDSFAHTWPLEHCVCVALPLPFYPLCLKYEVAGWTIALQYPLPFIHLFHLRWLEASSQLVIDLMDHHLQKFELIWLGYITSPHYLFFPNFSPLNIIL